MKVYKLTDKNGWTRRGSYNSCKWGVGVTHVAEGTGGLCTDGCIHAYTSPLLAVLLNPIHANIRNPILFEGEMEITHRDKADLKVGGRSLTITGKAPLPAPSFRQLVCFAILAAQAAFSLVNIPSLSQKNAEVFTEKVAEWNVWAKNYTEGAKTPAADAAAHAAHAADAAAHAAYAAAHAAHAAHAAAHAAYAAADAAAYAAAHAAYAADAAAHAAHAAADAAAYAAHAAGDNRLNLAEIAEKAMKIGIDG
jgi:hypothetical protein